MKKIILISILNLFMQTNTNFLGVALIHPEKGVTYHSIPQKWWDRAEKYCAKHYPALKQKPEIKTGQV